MPRLPGALAALMLLTFVGVGGASSCLFHESDRCDPGQTYDSVADLCVCPDSSNTIAGDHGCVPCGVNEVAVSGVCNCATGYTRPAAGAACAAIPTGLGAPCQSDTDCHSAMYTLCRVAASGGYCTSTACAADADCAGGYACNATATPSYCQRPPLGAGQGCTTDADCAGTEATYCENHSTHVCYVEGCSLSANDCFPGNDCCDLTGPSFGTIKKQICVASGTCAK